jgi:hypothetical protein
MEVYARRGKEMLKTEKSNVRISIANAGDKVKNLRKRDQKLKLLDV